MGKLNQDRILLIHPLGIAQDAASDHVARLANLMPPLGLASLAAYLEREGMSADIIDCFAQLDSDIAIERYLRERQPAFVGLTTTTSSFHDAVRLAELAKSVLGDEVCTILGGPHVSALGEPLLEQAPSVDVLVMGEGERPLLGLMQHEARDLHEVPGLIYRSGEETCSSGLQGAGIELDTLPFPAYDKLAGYPETYKLPIFNYPKTPNGSCVSSRGCPYVCSYCDRSVFRRSFRFNSADYLYEHVSHLHTKYGLRHINFYDDQFTLQRKRVESFCEKMIEGPLGMTFNCAVRADHIDPELLRLMKRAGCWMISLGVETGDPELLAQHRQGVDLDLLATRIRDIKAAGIRTKALLMMGLPGESELSVQRSMDYVFSLPIDDFNLAKFTPFPGSPLYPKIHELGSFDEDWRKLDCMHFQFIPEGMTRERLEELFTAFYRAHFTRVRTQWSYTTMLWRSPDSWLRFVGNLGSFLRFAMQGQSSKEA